MREITLWVVMLLSAPVFLAGGMTAAENIDPANDDSQRAYAENVGWINAEPSGNGGPGVQVDDFELTGYLWGENVGWISMSCKNTSSCATTSHGVVNDGNGVLSGYAWSENVGWVNFAPATAGVVIDATTGEFSGRAWGENIGWITFASTGANPYGTTTGWNCSPPPTVPSGSPSLTVGKSGSDALLTWSTAAGGTGYDIVQGDLGALRSGSGDFSSTDQCLDESRTSTSLSFATTPLAGNGFWFLVRGANCGGVGTYNTGQPTQVAPRDTGIAASGNDCPSSSLTVFVTTAVMNGNLGGEAGANAVCQGEADAAGLPGTYQAMLSTANVTPSDTAVPYFLPGGASSHYP